MTTRMEAMTLIHSVKPIYDITARGVQATLMLNEVMYEKLNVIFCVYNCVFGYCWRVVYC